MSVWVDCAMRKQSAAVATILRLSSTTVLPTPHYTSSDFFGLRHRVVVRDTSVDISVRRDQDEGGAGWSIEGDFEFSLFSYFNKLDICVSGNSTFGGFVMVAGTMKIYWCARLGCACLIFTPRDGKNENKQINYPCDGGKFNAGEGDLSGRNDAFEV